jgi:hypothetical protein
MKPGPRDHRHSLKIAGDELQELKRHIGAMAESFGVDRKIEKYQAPGRSRCTAGISTACST